MVCGLVWPLFGWRGNQPARRLFWHNPGDARRQLALSRWRRPVSVPQLQSAGLRERWHWLARGPGPAVPMMRFYTSDHEIGTTADVLPLLGERGRGSAGAHALFP